jgi:ATP-binding cassette subfamily F protein 3
LRHLGLALYESASSAYPPTTVSVVAITNLEKTFGQRVLFDKLWLNIEQGERIGLIGANGSGKSTLFKMILSEAVPDSGSVGIARGTRIGHLAQDPVFDPANNVMDEAELAFGELHALSHRLRELEHAMDGPTGEELDKILKQYEAAQHSFEAGGGYAWRHKLEATLLGVGLEEKAWEQPVNTLSGGQRSRLALAKILIAEPDLLLLDEPTNHLDLIAIEWLEKYLLEFSGAVLLISHDRYLLDRLATRIVYLNKRKIDSYPGNYSAFVVQRDLAELTQHRQHAEQQADIEKQKEFIRRFGAGQRSKEAKGREKRLNRLLASDQVIAAVENNKSIRLSLDTDRRGGNQVLQVRELSKAFENNVLWKDLKFTVVRGERIGILGPNGSGKTTLLNSLIGHADADAGDIKWGSNLEIGYYDQRLDDFEMEATVMEEASADHDGRPQEVRDMLGALLFSGDDVEKQVKLLSGGERARLRLVQLLLDKPNVLLLDEPTNHLDIASCEALEKMLTQFPGTILCVSHDRYFLNKVAGRLMILEPPNMIDFEGTYSAWAAKHAAAVQEQQEAASAKRKPSNSPSQKPAANKPNPAKKDNSNWSRPFGKLSLPDLERQITETEIAVAEHEQQFAGAGTQKDVKRGRNLRAEYDALSKKLKDLEAEYFARER